MKGVTGLFKATGGNEVCAHNSKADKFDFGNVVMISQQPSAPGNMRGISAPQYNS